LSVLPNRWQEIAEETAKEKDESKVLELAQELIQAMDAESEENVRREQSVKKHTA
jgi:hypothetical protein